MKFNLTLVLIVIAFLSIKCSPEKPDKEEPVYVIRLESITQSLVGVDVLKLNIKFDYDSLGRLSQVLEFNDGILDTRRQFLYSDSDKLPYYETYERKAGRLGIDSPSPEDWVLQQKINYSYNSSTKILTAKVQGSFMSGEFHYYFDSNDNIEKEVYKSELFRTYRYDSKQNMIEILVGDNLDHYFSFAYDSYKNPYNDLSIIGFSTGLLDYFCFYSKNNITKMYDGTYEIQYEYNENMYPIKAIFWKGGLKTNQMIEYSYKTIKVIDPQ